MVFMYPCYYTSCDRAIVCTYCRAAYRTYLLDLVSTLTIDGLDSQNLSFHFSKRKTRRLEISRETSSSTESERKTRNRKEMKFDANGGVSVSRVCKQKRECNSLPVPAPTIAPQLISKLKSKFFGPRLRSKHLRKPLPEYFLNASRLTKDARGSFFYTHCRSREYNREYLCIILPLVGELRVA